MDLLELVREGNHVVPSHRIPQASLGTGADDNKCEHREDHEADEDLDQPVGQPELSDG